MRPIWAASAILQGEEGVFVPEACAHEAFEEGDKSYKANINGFDSVEYLLAAGPAEPLRPLSTVASGGERSRIMLALKGAPLSYGASPEETLEGKACIALTLQAYSPASWSARRK